MGRLFIYYEDGSPYHDYHVQFSARFRGAHLTPDRVLPRLFGFASWFLPKPKSDVSQLEARIGSLERQMLGYPIADDDYRALGISAGAERSWSPRTW